MFMMASLFMAYIVYNTIFLSDMTENETTTELNMIALYIIWLTFILSIVLSSRAPGDFTKMSKRSPRGLSSIEF